MAWTPDDAHVDEGELTLRDGLRLSSNRAAVLLPAPAGPSMVTITGRVSGWCKRELAPTVREGL